MSEFESVSWEGANDRNGTTVGADEPEEYDYGESSSKAAAAAADQQSPSSPSSVRTHSNVRFTITVGEPQKEQEGTQNAYISYLVVTDTNSPSFQSPNVRVRRRFSDFVFLYTTLLNEFPACAVPPLPDKQRLEYLKGDRFGPEFTLRRASSLQRFLSRISHHPSLKKSRTFYTFLESNDWNAYRKRRSLSDASGPSRSGGIVISNPTADDNPSQLGAGGDVSAQQHLSDTGAPGFLEGISDSFLNAFSRVSAPSKELADIRERSDKLEDNLLHIEKAYTRAIRRQGDIGGDLREFSAQISKLAELEPHLASEFGTFATGIDSYAHAELVLRDYLDGDYIVSLRDMENYVTTIKSLIKLREQKQLDFEALTDYLHRATVERDSLRAGGGTNFIRAKVEDLRGVDHEASRQERLRKSETKVHELEREVTNAKLTSDAFEEFAINEVKIFETIKNIEMRDTLVTLADNNIKFYQSIIDQWGAEF